MIDIFVLEIVIQRLLVTSWQPSGLLTSVYKDDGNPYEILVLSELFVNYRCKIANNRAKISTFANRSVKTGFTLESNFESARHYRE